MSSSLFKIVGCWVLITNYKTNKLEKQIEELKEKWKYFLGHRFFDFFARVEQAERNKCTVVTEGQWSIQACVYEGMWRLSSLLRISPWIRLPPLPPLIPFPLLEKPTTDFATLLFEGHFP